MITVVAILNWNGLNHLKTFLPSVLKHSTGEGNKVLVIDNGSTDESCSWIRENHPSVELLNLERNYGFSGGYNRGLSGIKADRYVLLNSDVEVSDGWIDRINKSMNEMGFSACSPRILHHSSPSQFEYAGAAGGYVDRDGYMFCAGRIFDSYEDADFNYTDDR